MALAGTGVKEMQAFLGVGCKGDVVQLTCEGMLCPWASHRLCQEEKNPF